MRKGCARTREIAILPQFLAIEHHFLKSQFFLPPCFRRSNLISCERVATGTQKSQFYRSFWRSNIISCERVATGPVKSQFYPSFWRSNIISCERVATGTRKSQFYRSFGRSNLISCERVAFRAVSLALPCAFKREIEKKERARGQEGMRAREQEGKRESEDVKMNRCEDEKMWRWTDVKMNRCEDEKMWRWEDVKIWRCYHRPLLEEPFAQTLSGTIELSVPLRGRSDHDPGSNERVSKPPAGKASPSIFRDTFCPAKHR